MSNQLSTRNIPSIKEREFKFRSIMSSSELNNMQKESFDDILDLFNRANQIQKSIYELKLMNDIESYCYARKLQEVMANVSQLHEQYQNMTDPDLDFRIMTEYVYDATTNNDDFAAMVDCNSSSVTAHVSNSVSKTCLYDETYDEILVPPSLQVYIGPDSFKDNPSVITIEDTDPLNAFSGSNTDAWFRKIISTIDLDYIDNELVIGLPEDIITTRLINQIDISLFPIGQVDVLGVYYKTNGAWELVPGFQAHHSCKEYSDIQDTFGNPVYYSAIRDASNLKFNFPAVQANQIRIKLRVRQANSIPDLQNNRRIWYLGIRNINITHNTYTRDHSDFEMIYTFKETDRNIMIYNVEPLYNNTLEDTTYSISKEYFYYDSDGNTHKVVNTCPFRLQGHKMMVRFTIDGTQETPNIYGARVKYKLS